MVPDPRDPMFGVKPLPDWVKEFRPVQWEKVQEVVSLYRDGVDVVFLEAPTGTGKTLIAETVRRLLNANCYYTCTTKSLQDQFARDFPDARVLKGRSNYLTAEGNIDFLGQARRPGDDRPSAITCADCTQMGMGDLDDDDEVEDCLWCPYKLACPFQQAKAYMNAAELAVLNTHYLLSDLGLERRNLVVADEADVIESTLMGHVSVELTPAAMAKYGLRPPQKRTVESEWVRWCEYATFELKQYADDLPLVRDISVVKERTRARRLAAQLKQIAKEIPEGGWVYDGYNRHADHVEFKPIRVSKYAPTLLWPKGEKWLLMSATLISPMLMADDLGMLEAGLSWDAVQVPLGFEPSRRPIFYTPAANMRFKDKAEQLPKMSEAVAAVLDRHPDDRILVHTVSYDLASYLLNTIDRPDRTILTYRSAHDRESALATYSSTPGAVLLAPSLERGIDLPGDLCRVQIIAKIPFPNIKDQQIAKRMYSDGGSAWYRMLTIRSIVQMCGRGMRSENDTCTTYILDSQFLDNLWKSDYLFPDWWKDAVRWDMSFDRLVRGAST